MNARTPIAALALCAVAFAAPAAPAGALVAPVPRQVATVASTYVVSEILIYEGDTLTLTNLDAQLTHDLVSRNVVGGVRIFGSGPADPGKQADVARVSSLPRGVYPFFCSLHESMIGNLRVDAAPTR